MLNMHKGSSFLEKKCSQCFLAETLMQKKTIEKPAIKHMANFLQHTQNSPTRMSIVVSCVEGKGFSFQAKNCVTSVFSYYTPLLPHTCTG